MKTPDACPYTMLGLPMGTRDLNVIKAAYHQRILRCKPDKSGNIYTPEFQKIMDCYNYLVKTADQQLPSSSSFANASTMARMGPMRPMSTAPRDQTNNSFAMRSEWVNPMGRMGPMRPLDTLTSIGQSSMEPEPSRLSNQDAAARLREASTIRAQQDQMAKAAVTKNPSSVFFGTVDEQAFMRELKTRKVPSKYTTADLPVPKNILNNKSFDNQTFNALFELSKKRAQQDGESTNGVINPFDGFSDVDLCSSKVAEFNGLMLIRPDESNDTRFFGDLNKFERDSNMSVTLAINEVDPIELLKVKSSLESVPMSEIEARQRMQEYKEYKGDDLPSTSVNNYKEGEQYLMNQRMAQIEHDRLMSLQFIQKNLTAYPELTRKMFQGGQLEHTICAPTIEGQYQLPQTLQQLPSSQFASQIPLQYTSQFQQIPQFNTLQSNLSQQFPQSFSQMQRSPQWYG